MKISGFLCNCGSDFNQWFDTLGIPRGSLLVKFLGVPMISSQLSVNDFMPLINKITTRLCSWATLLLSFVGRVLLIKSVIHAIESFWSNHFMLPNSVHATIQSLLTHFMWKGNINDKGGAKVSWDIICLPREEGGLGLKNMINWNQAQLISHLLNVVTHKPSLWPSWINATVLKHKHFWTLKITTDCSRIWRKVLKHRSLALQFISFFIANGNNISLWFDPW